MNEKKKKLPKMIEKLGDVLGFIQWCEDHEKYMEKDDTVLFGFVNPKRGYPDYVLKIIFKDRNYYNQWIKEYLSRSPEKQYPV